MNVSDPNGSPHDASEREHPEIENEEPQFGQTDSDASHDNSPFATEQRFRSGNDSPDVGDVPTQEQDSSDLQQQLNEANERVLRGQAELENYRKRSRREMEEQQRYAPLPIIRDLLSVVDNLERAVTATDGADGTTVESLLEGVKLVT